MEPIAEKNISEEEIDKLLKLKRKTVYPEVGWRGSLFLGILSLILAFALMPSFTLPRRIFVEGESAPFQVKARRSFEIIDHQATQKLKESAENSVKSVYDYDPKLYSETVKKLFKAFERMKKDYYTGPQTSLDSAQTREGAKKAFEETLGGIQIDEDLFAYLERARFNWRISWSVNRLIHLLKKHYVISDKGSLGLDVERGIAIHDVETKQEFSFTDLDQILDVQEAKAKVRQGPPQIYKIYEQDAREYVARLATTLIFANLSLNTAQTKSRKTLAAGEIKPIIFLVDKGATIIRKGEAVQKRHLVILDGIRTQFTEQRPGLFIFFTAIFLFFFFQILSTFALGNFSRFKPTQKDMLLLGALVLVFLVVVRIYLFSAGAIGDKFDWIPSSMFMYLVPVAAGAMMVRFLIGMEGALVFSWAVSVILSLLFERNFLFAIYAFTSCLVGIQSVDRCRAYTDIYKAGLKVSVANVAVVFSIIILSSLGVTASYEKIFVEMICGIAAGFFSGILSAILVVAVTPLFEYVFGYTTDVKLLELSNLNNPVLRDLMIRAPGSYHHSIMVGTLAEHAAEAIGANVLLARVGGYYHDVGKMKNPHYYIENQFGGFNIHEKQPPHLSKTMIVSHVKAGIRIGLDRKLGQRVIDVIAQHHGTTLVVYFFEKAKKEAQASVNEEEYRYSGPRPQTVEAAIVMMADSVEAATRAMNTSKLTKLKVVCEKIVNRLFTDGQLEESDLTLKDLGAIADSFYHVLMGVYHRRISYPGGIVAEQPYDANYYPKQAKKSEGSQEKDSDMDQNDVFKKMGT